MTAEHQRLRQSRECGVRWRKWGPYLRERQWGAPREQRSEGGRTRQCLTYEQAPLWAYEWGEDGLAGICDETMTLCFAIALWDGRDRALKERSAAAPAGEAVQEDCIYLDNVPTHSYMLALCRYSGCFDVLVEYAKASPEEILIRITVHNCASSEACLHVLPQLWFRNTWRNDSGSAQPLIERATRRTDARILIARHRDFGVHYLQCDCAGRLLFTGNDTNTRDLFGLPNAMLQVKDGIGQYLLHGRHEALGRDERGTKAAAHYELAMGAGDSRRIHLKLSAAVPDARPLDLAQFDATIRQRRAEADEFYAALTPAERDADFLPSFRRAFATALWGKYTHIYEVGAWLHDHRASAGGRRNAPTEPPTRFNMRLGHVIAMPDKWRQPRFEAPRTVLHTVALAFVDPDLASDQLELLLNRRHDDADGHARPGTEDRVAPAMHAWAALFMYRLQRVDDARAAIGALHRSFNVLVLRAVDPDWAALYLQSMLEIAIELALFDAQYEDYAIEIYARFVMLVSAMDLRCADIPIDERHAAHDVPVLSDGARMKLEIGSAAGRLAVYAATMFPIAVMTKLPRLVEHVYWSTCGSALAWRSVHTSQAAASGRRVLVMADERPVRSMLTSLLDPRESTFLPGEEANGFHRSVLLLRALLSLHECYGDAVQVECPSGSGRRLTLIEIGAEIARSAKASLLRSSCVDPASDRWLQSTHDPQRRDLLRFCERVYCGGTGGVHRCGWVGFIAPLLCLACGYEPFERVAMPTRSQQKIASA